MSEDAVERQAARVVNLPDMTAERLSLIELQDIRGSMDQS
jgi:hypothetical protein